MDLAYRIEQLASEYTSSSFFDVPITTLSAAMRSTQSNNCAIETHDSSMSQRIGEKIAATDQRWTFSAPRFRRSGFTLLEVMIVVVILGILAALEVPKIISRPDEARAIA